MIFNLKSKLDEWAAASLITVDQRQRILTHEEKQGSRPWVMFGIVGIGVVAVATGVVSLIAANWFDVPANFKLFCYFVMQIATGYAFIRQAEQPGFWREGILILFALLFFGGIGLVGQIYNLHSGNWQPIAFWLALTLPATLLAQKQLLPHIWTMLVLLAGIFWSYEGRGIYDEQARFCLFMTFPLALLTVGFISDYFPSFPHKLRNAFYIWGVIAVLIVGSLFANEFWLHASYRSGGEKFFDRYLVLPLAAWIVAITRSLNVKSISQSSRIFNTLTLLAIGPYLALPQFLRTDLSETSRQLVGASGFILIWSLAAGAAATRGSKRLFDFASCAIAIRFIVIYFEVFGNLSTTGVGLVISGVLILAVAWIWHRYRNLAAATLGGRL